MADRSGKVNLNSASLDEIARVPMIDRKKAEYIVNHRPFRSWDDLKRVPGFSEDMLDNLKDNAVI